MPLCTPDQMECMRNITIDEAKCGQKCSGLLVPSYYKDNVKNEDWIRSFHSNKSALHEAYWKYKGFYKFPSAFESRFIIYFY